MAVRVCGDLFNLNVLSVMPKCGNVEMYNVVIEKIMRSISITTLPHFKFQH